MILLQILAMDINRENYELGLPVIEKAGVAHKIEFREGPALPVLDQMVEDVSQPIPPTSSIPPLLSLVISLIGVFIPLNYYIVKLLYCHLLID